MSRLSAALVHLTISFAIATILFALAWFVYYPAPTFVAIGGFDVFLLLVGIDVILGPLLTLLVFKSGKRSLKFDLAVIALLQLAALIYGASKIYEARPVFIAALGSKFQLVQATEVNDGNVKKSGRSLPMFGPKWVGTKAPTNRLDIEEVNDVTNLAGGGLGHFPQFHLPFEETASVVLAQARPIERLFAVPGNDPDKIKAWLDKRGYTPERARYQPVEITVSRFALMLDAATGAPIGMSPFRSDE